MEKTVKTDSAHRMLLEGMAHVTSIRRMDNNKKNPNMAHVDTTTPHGEKARE